MKYSINMKWDDDSVKKNWNTDRAANECAY